MFRNVFERSMWFVFILHNSKSETLKLNMHTNLASFLFNFGQLHVLILKDNQFLRMKMKRERSGWFNFAICSM